MLAALTRWLSRKAGFGVLLAGVLLAALGASPAADAQQADRPLNIAFVVKNVVNPFWKLARLGADKAAEDFGGVRVIHVAPTKPDDLNESIQIMEDLITRYQAGAVDAVVFVPVDYKAMVPVVEKANRAGVPIINYSNRLAAGGEYITFIGYDDRQIARDAAEYIMQKLGGKGNVIILEGVPGAITAQDRLAGFMDVIEKYPDVKLLASQTSNYSRAQAIQVMENLLVQFPQVDAVLASSDEEALGAIKALEAVGKAGRVLVSGINGTLEALDAIMAGKLTVTVDYSGYEQGYQAMAAAIRYLRGEKVEGDVSLKHILVDRENAEEFMEIQKAQLGQI